MSESRTEIFVGALVMAVAIAFAVFTAQRTGLSGQSAGYALSASFRSAEGVQVGTDVRLAGVKIGTVTDVALDPETFRAKTMFMLQNGIEIPDDSSALVSSEGLLGGTFIEINPGGSLFTYESGDEIIDTQGSVSLISLLLKFVSSGNNQ